MATKKQAKNQNKELAIVEGEVMREAPQERRIEINEILQSKISRAQLIILTGQTPKWAVKVRQGKGGKMFKYVPHGYVTDVLNKAFGFDWDLVLDPIENGKLYSLVIDGDDRHTVVSGHLVIRVRDNKGNLLTEIKKYGFGSQTWNKTMELGDALKGARSDLIKTCGFQLGIGLDLYYNERAELDDFGKREASKQEEQRIAEELINKDPDSPILLITRSMSEFGYDGAKLAEILDTTIDLLMIITPEGIAENWKKVKAYASKHK